MLKKLSIFASLALALAGFPAGKAHAQIPVRLLNADSLELMLEKKIPIDEICSEFNLQPNSIGADMGWTTLDEEGGVAYTVPANLSKDEQKKIKEASEAFYKRLKKLKFPEERIPNLNLAVNYATLETMAAEANSEKVGIFYTGPSGEEKQIAPVGKSWDEVKGKFGGIGTSTYAVYPRPAANNVVTEARPEFVLVLAGEQETLEHPSYTNVWFASASGPEDFLLVKLDTDKKNRRLKVGSSSGVPFVSKGRFGIDQKAIIDTQVEELDDNSFKITPASPLAPGEYAFIYNGTVTTGYNGVIFDFSIPKTQKK